MKYNFDILPDRRNTNSLKWDINENELPLWVADMDFECAPEILQDLQNTLNQKVFGYSITGTQWRQSYINWWKENHGFEISGEWLVFCTGVVPAISSTVRKITTPGENVVIMTPCYNIFFNSILNNGRNVLESPLVYDGRDYTVDFADLEKKLVDPQTSLLILCNPQNPVGKIWSREILEKIGHLCARHNVVVLSDEIHCDITEPGKDYVPFASVDQICRENCIMACAPTKAFNLAGIQTAAVVVPNRTLRHKIWRGLNTDECGEPNIFAVPAAVSAFSRGKPWLDEMRSYVFENRRFVETYIEENIPEIRAVKGDATYLVWIDISSMKIESDRFTSLLREKTGLWLSDGVEYGQGGKYFVRMNLATSRRNVVEALKRLENFIKNN